MKRLQFSIPLNLALHLADDAKVDLALDSIALVEWSGSYPRQLHMLKTDDGYGFHQLELPECGARRPGFSPISKKKYTAEEVAELVAIFKLSHDSDMVYEVTPLKDGQWRAQYVGKYPDIYGSGATIQAAADSLRSSYNTE